MENRELVWWVALALVPEIGPVKSRILLEYFSEPSEIFKAKEELRHFPGLTSRDVESITGFDIKMAEEEVALAEENGVQIIPYNDPVYPSLLKEIPDPPPIIYCQGTISEVDNLAVAVVGTRLASLYGLVQSERFAAGLAESHFTVVSGLARGIDTAAHRGALRVKGRTIAVLGSGLLRLYPPENEKLAKEIIGSGAIISELPLKTGPDRQTFPRRNRIISGLSRAVLVVEAGKQSGALITASLALEQGREVFALPGPVDQETSAGTNNLIKEGAHLVTSPQDIVLELYPTLPFPKRESASKETREEKEDSIPSCLFEELKRLLSNQEMASIDEIAAHLNLSLPEVTRLLTELEVKGLIKETFGKRFLLVKDP